jgi:hypothetical protein
MFSSELDQDYHILDGGAKFPVLANFTFAIKALLQIYHVLGLKRERRIKKRNMSIEAT